MTKPVSTIETIATSCIAGRIRMQNRIVTNLDDEALRPSRVKLSQGNVLAVTAKLGS
jgi:predicted polyphosphate/ATP-dependent NAD kinase